jgi:hypothetical protein
VISPKLEKGGKSEEGRGGRWSEERVKNVIYGRESLDPVEELYTKELEISTEKERLSVERMV